MVPRWTKSESRLEIRLGTMSPLILRSGETGKRAPAVTNIPSPSFNSLGHHLPILKNPPRVIPRKSRRRLSHRLLPLLVFHEKPADALMIRCRVQVDPKSCCPREPVSSLFGSPARDAQARVGRSCAAVNSLKKLKISSGSVSREIVEHECRQSCEDPSVPQLCG
jgi:hypothetical protein